MEDPVVARIRDIPQFTRDGNYAVDLWWRDLDGYIERQIEEKPFLDIDPDFQRAHVWTEAQQIAFVEYGLRGGRSGMNIHLNCVGWMGNFKGPYVLVDGKQRLNAVLRFLRSEIPAFGVLSKDYEDKLSLTGPRFRWCVNDLKTRAEVLTWYLEMNTGGTPHTADEIKKVEKLLVAERKK